MNTLKLIRWSSYAAIIALVLVVAFVLIRPASSGPALATMNGEAVHLSDFRGKPYGMFFGFTHCPDVCPTTMQEVTETMVSAGEKARDFRVFFVTVDPKRDTPELMRSYLGAFDPRLTGLTGSEEALATLRKEFGIVAQKVGEGESYTFNHTASVLLFDAKGAFAGTFASSDTNETRLAKLNRLLGG